MTNSKNIESSSLKGPALNIKLLNLGLILLGLFFTVTFFVSLKLHSDHIQILNKVFLLSEKGIWSHYGNAGTGVGFVPGSFLTFVTAIPMQIYFSPYSAMAVIALFHLISLFLLKKVMVQAAKPLIVTDLLLLYWLSPWRVEQAELYNPGYLFLFAALHFYTAFQMREKNFWMTLLHVLAVGFCVQVHYSALILIILSFVLLFVRYFKVDWRAFSIGIGLVLLSLVPYMIDRLTNDQLGVTLNKSSDSYLGRNFVMVYPVLKGIVYWFRYGSIYYGRHIFSEINFAWIEPGFLQTAVSGVFHVLKWPLAAVTLIYSFMVQGRIFKKLWNKELFRRTRLVRFEPEDRWQQYAAYMFVAMIIAVCLSPVEFNHWHLILCFPIVTVLMTSHFNSLRQKLSKRTFRLLFVSVLLVFVAFDLFGSLGSRSHSYKGNFHKEALEYFETWKTEN